VLQWHAEDAVYKPQAQITDRGSAGKYRARSRILIWRVLRTVHRSP
jgi:hypothetical protein